jgi:hypothetical protein
MSFRTYDLQIVNSQLDKYLITDSEGNVIFTDNIVKQKIVFEKSWNEFSISSDGSLHIFKTKRPFYYKIIRPEPPLMGPAIVKFVRFFYKENESSDWLEIPYQTLIPDRPRPRIIQNWVFNTPGNAGNSSIGRIEYLADGIQLTNQQYWEKYRYRLEIEEAYSFFTPTIALCRTDGNKITKSSIIRDRTSQGYSLTQLEEKGELSYSAVYQDNTRTITYPTHLYISEFEYNQELPNNFSIEMYRLGIPPKGVRRNGKSSILVPIHYSSNNLIKFADLSDKHKCIYGTFLVRLRDMENNIVTNFAMGYIYVKKAHVYLTNGSFALYTFSGIKL